MYYNRQRLIYGIAMGKPLFIPSGPIEAGALVHRHEARAVLERNAVFLQEIRIGDHLLELDDSSNTRAVNRLVTKIPGLKRDGVILRRLEPLAVLRKQLTAKKARGEAGEMAVVCYRCSSQDDHPICAEEVRQVFEKILSSCHSVKWTLRLLGSHEVLIPMLKRLTDVLHRGRIEACMEIRTELTSAGVPEWCAMDISELKSVTRTQFPVSAFLRPRHPFKDWNLACTEFTEQFPTLKGLWAEYAGETQQRRYGMEFYAALVGTGASVVFLPPSKTEADFWDHKTKALILPVAKSVSVDPVARIMGLLEVSKPEEERRIRILLGRVRNEKFSIPVCDALFQLTNLNAAASKRVLHTRRLRLFEIMTTCADLNDISYDRLKHLYEIGDFMESLRQEKSKGALPKRVAHIEALFEAFDSRKHQIDCWRRIAKTLSRKEATLKEVVMAIRAYANEKKISLRASKSSPNKQPRLLAGLRNVQSEIANRYPEDYDSLFKLEEVIRSLEKREKILPSEKAIPNSNENKTAGSESATASSEALDTPPC